MPTPTPLRTHLEFVSDAFPSYPDEEDAINPGIWGKRLAEYLIENLPDQGVIAFEPIPEDWGWMIPVRNEAFKIFIGCSNQTEPDGNRFLCFIDPSKPRVRKGLFGKIDATPDIERVGTAVYKVLASHPQVRDLRWWDGNKG